MSIIADMWPLLVIVIMVTVGALYGIFKLGMWWRDELYRREALRNWKEILRKIAERENKNDTL